MIYSLFLPVLIMVPDNRRLRLRNLYQHLRANSKLLAFQFMRKYSRNLVHLERFILAQSFEVLVLAETSHNLGLGCVRAPTGNLDSPLGAGGISVGESSRRRALQ